MKLAKSLIDNLLKLIKLPQDATPNSETIIHTIVAAVLTRSTLLLHGPPGCAKSTAIKMIAKAFGVTGQWRINGGVDTKEEDLVGALDIVAMTNGEGRKVIFSPLMSSPMMLIDEIDKIPSFCQAPLLPVLAEGEARVGTECQIVPPRFTAMTMNPPAPGQGNFELPEAIKDRLDLEIRFPSTTFAELTDIFSNVMDNQGDLTKAMPTLGSMEELKALQDQVAALPITREAKVAAAMYIHASTACCKDAKVEMINFPACCSDCEFANSSFYCSKIAPLSARTGLSALKVAKGIAYLRGSKQVEKQDVDKVFPMVMSHRVNFINVPVDSFRIFVPEFFGRLSKEVQRAFDVVMDPDTTIKKAMEQGSLDRLKETTDPLLRQAVKMAEASMARVGDNVKADLGTMDTHSLKQAKRMFKEPVERSMIDSMIIARSTVSITIPNEDLLMDQMFRDTFSTPDGEPFVTSLKWDELAAEGQATQGSLGLGLGVDMFYANGKLNVEFSDGSHADLFRAEVQAALPSFGSELLCPYAVAGHTDKLIELGFLSNPEETTEEGEV